MTEQQRRGGEKERPAGGDHPEGGTGSSRASWSDDDQLVYVNGVLKGKLLENETCPAANNSKEQFANSPTSPCPDERHHGCAGSPQHDERPGARIGAGAGRSGRNPAGPAQLYEALRTRAQWDAAARLTAGAGFSPAAAAGRGAPAGCCDPARASAQAAGRAARPESSPGRTTPGNARADRPAGGP